MCSSLNAANFQVLSTFFSIFLLLLDYDEGRHCACPPTDGKKYIYKTPDAVIMNKDDMLSYASTFSKRRVVIFIALDIYEPQKISVRRHCGALIFIRVDIYSHQYVIVNSRFNQRHSFCFIATASCRFRFFFFAYRSINARRNMFTLLDANVCRFDFASGKRVETFQQEKFNQTL